MKIFTDNITLGRLMTASERFRVCELAFRKLASGNTTPAKAAHEAAEILTDLVQCVSRDLGTPPDPTPAEIADELETIADAIQRAHDDRCGTQSTIDSLADYINTLKKL